MKRIDQWAWAGLAATILTFPGLAHDLKLFGSKLNGEVGDQSTLYVTEGHLNPVDKPVEADALETFLLKSPNGSQRPLVAKETGLHANIVRLEEAGVYQGLVIRKPAVQTKYKTKAGTHEHKPGNRKATLDSIKAEGGEPLETLRGQEFAKVIITVGQGKQRAATSGLPFEISPVDPMADWRVGTPLRLKVTYNDRPLANAQVQGTYIGARNLPGADEAWQVTGTTNAEGLVVFNCKQPATWLFRCEHELPVEANARKDYDREAYGTSLTMEIKE
jgi:uncharacterized GH25 family protein